MSDPSYLFLIEERQENSPIKVDTFKNTTACSITETLDIIGCMEIRLRFNTRLYPHILLLNTKPTPGTDPLTIDMVETYLNTMTPEQITAWISRAEIDG